MNVLRAVFEFCCLSFPLFVIDFFIYILCSSTALYERDDGKFVCSQNRSSLFSTNSHISLSKLMGFCWKGQTSECCVDDALKANVLELRDAWQDAIGAEEPVICLIWWLSESVYVNETENSEDDSSGTLLFWYTEAGSSWVVEIVSIWSIAWYMSSTFLSWSFAVLERCWKHEVIGLNWHRIEGTGNWWEHGSCKSELMWRTVQEVIGLCLLFKRAASGIVLRHILMPRNKNVLFHGCVSGNHIEYRGSIHQVSSNCLRNAQGENVTRVMW